MTSTSFPPLSFLLGASTNSLEDLELAALNRRANLAKAVRYELEQWIEQSAAVMVARWMVENREALMGGTPAIEARPVLEALFTSSEAAFRRPRRGLLFFEMLRTLTDGSTYLFVCICCG